MSTEISSTTVHSSIACSYAITSKWLCSASKNVSRLIDARLHAVLSRNMYSLHGLDALMRPSAGQVCHSLIVESNCSPGSAQRHAARQIWSHRSRARMVLETSPSVRRRSTHASSFSTARKKSWVRRTELFEFWPLTV